MNYLFEYFDIFLSIAISIILIFIIFSKKSPINTLINFLVCNFLTMIIAFSILDKQLHIGQYIIINIIFLLVIMVAFFYMQNNNNLKSMAEKMKKVKIKSYLMLFLSIVIISSFAFAILIKNPRKTNLEFSPQNTLKKKDDFYHEKIKELNQNKIFQSITEIIIIYSGISVALLFFTKKNKVVK